MGTLETTPKKSREFTQTDKRKITKALAFVRNSGYILRFHEEMRGIHNSSKLAFSATLACKPEPLSLIFFATNLLVVDNFSSTVDGKHEMIFLVGSDATVKKMGEILLNRLIRMDRGLMIESEAIARAQEILKAVPGYYGICSFTKSSDSDDGLGGFDVNGTSVWGPFELEIKALGVSSRHHEKTHPDKPLIHYDPAWTNAEYFEKIANIAQSLGTNKKVKFL